MNDKPLFVKFLKITLFSVLTVFWNELLIPYIILFHVAFYFSFVIKVSFINTVQVIC